MKKIVRVLCLALICVFCMLNTCMASETALSYSGTDIQNWTWGGVWCNTGATTVEGSAVLQGDGSVYLTPAESGGEKSNLQTDLPSNMEAATLKFTIQFKVDNANDRPIFNVVHEENSHASRNTTVSHQVAIRNGKIALVVFENGISTSGQSERKCYITDIPAPVGEYQTIVLKVKNDDTPGTRYSVLGNENLTVMVNDSNPYYQSYATVRKFKQVQFPIDGAVEGGFFVKSLGIAIDYNDVELAPRFYQNFTGFQEGVIDSAESSTSGKILPSLPAFEVYAPDSNAASWNLSITADKDLKFTAEFETAQYSYKELKKNFKPKSDGQIKITTTIKIDNNDNRALLYLRNSSNTVIGEIGIVNDAFYIKDGAADNPRSFNGPIELDVYITVNIIVDVENWKYKAWFGEESGVIGWVDLYSSIDQSARNFAHIGYLSRRAKSISIKDLAASVYKPMPGTLYYDGNVIDGLDGMEGKDVEFQYDYEFEDDIQNAKLIMAAYIGDKLEYISITQQNIFGGDTSTLGFRFKVPQNLESLTFKAFVWNSMDAVQPKMPTLDLWEG